MNIHIGRYTTPTADERAKVETEHPDCLWPSDTYEGWVEDDARTWIVFIPTNSGPEVFLNRDADGGVID